VDIDGQWRGGVTQFLDELGTDVTDTEVRGQSVIGLVHRNRGDRSDPAAGQSAREDRRQTRPVEMGPGPLLIVPQVTPPLTVWANPLKPDPLCSGVERMTV
jgi:hypothetical protein